MQRDKNIYFKFLGSLTKRGNKVKAKRLLDKALIKSSEKNGMPSYLIVHQTFSKLQSFLEIKKIKIRKNVHLVPFPLTRKRQDFLRIKWFLEVIKSDTRRISFSEKLAEEMSSVLSDRRSKVILKKKQTNNEVISNRSNIHFR
jgi:ribosomal protein S7